MMTMATPDTNSDARCAARYSTLAQPRATRKVLSQPTSSSRTQMQKEQDGHFHATGHQKSRWEITAEERLQDIQLRYPNRLKGIDVYGNSQQILQAYLASQGSANHMNQHYMSAERIAWFRNSVPNWNKGESLDRVSRDGFQGNSLCLGSQVEFNAITTEQWPDTIAMMANELARVRHQLSLSDKD